MISLTKVARLKRIIKLLPGCHVEPAKNALAAWRYCGKEDTRVEGPLQFGTPPACRYIKGDTQARNKLIFELGVVKATEQGVIPIEKFKQVKQSLDLFQLMKKEATDIDTL